MHIQLYQTRVQTMLQLVKQITAAGAVSKVVAMVDCAILIVYTACLGWMPIIFRSLAALL